MKIAIRFIEKRNKNTRKYGQNLRFSSNFSPNLQNESKHVFTSFDQMFGHSKHFYA